MHALATLFLNSGYLYIMTNANLLPATLPDYDTHLLIIHIISANLCVYFSHTHTLRAEIKIREFLATDILLDVWRDNNAVYI
jgi:hypothetical protein